MPSSKVAPAPPPPAKPGRAPPPPPSRPPPLQAAGVGELDEEDEEELDEDDEDDDDDDDDDDDNDDDDSDGEEKEGGEDFEDDSRASGGSGDSSSLSSEDSQYYREDEGTYVRPNIRATVRKMTEVERRQRHDTEVRMMRVKAEGGSRQKAADSKAAKFADKKTLAEAAGEFFERRGGAARRGAEELEKKRRAAEESKMLADVTQARAAFAHHETERSAAMSAVEGARLQAAEDARALAAVEAARKAMDEKLLRGRDKDERAADYANQVIEAQSLQKAELVAVRALRAKPLLPPMSKTAEQWREAIRMANEEAAREAVLREMKRGAPFFDPPRTVEDIATCTVAFFSLPGVKASVTGFARTARVDDHMASLITLVRSVLLADYFEAGEALVELDDLRDALQRQGATRRMLRHTGVSFGRFASALVFFTRRLPPAPTEPLLHLVPKHPKVNRVMPRFSDLAPVAATWHVPKPGLSPTDRRQGALT